MQKHTRTVDTRLTRRCCAAARVVGTPNSDAFLRAQCELIVQRFGLAHISAGDLLRAEVAAGTDAGKRAQSFMDRGDLVPDEARARERSARAQVAMSRKAPACASAAA
jgi:hypothetical protein